MRTAKCPDCDKTFNVFTKKSRGWNRTPHARCEVCWKKNRRSKAGQTGAINADFDLCGQISAISNENPPSSSKKTKKSGTKPLDHQIFTRGEWRRAQITLHPTVNLRINIDGRRSESVDVEAVADTGAQSNIWSLENFLKAGFMMSDLSPATLSLNAANKSPIKINGVFHA